MSLSSQSTIQKYLKNIGVNAIVKIKELKAKEIIENEEWLPINKEDTFKESLLGFRSQSYLDNINKINFLTIPLRALIIL